jgi:hypothetical protein
MTRKRIAIIGGAVVVLAVGSVGAVAATKSDEAKKRENAVLSTAAKELDVSPQELRDALKAGQSAQLEQAVKDGKLTQAQADAMKRQMERSGLVLGGHRGMHGPGGHGGPGHRGGGHEMMADVAKALGLSEAELHEQLRDGKTLAQIAKAQDKDLDDVKASVKKAATARLDQAVKDGDITKAQRDDMLEHIDEHLDHLGERRVGKHGGGRGMPGPPERNENGSYGAPQAGAMRTD